MEEPLWKCNVLFSLRWPCQASVLFTHFVFWIPSISFADNQLFFTAHKQHDQWQVPSLLYCNHKKSFDHSCKIRPSLVGVWFGKTLLSNGAGRSLAQLEVSSISGFVFRSASVATLSLSTSWACCSPLLLALASPVTSTAPTLFETGLKMG